MTPREAARIIGCTIHHARKLMRDGKIPARRVLSRDGQQEWDVNEKSVQEFCRKPQIRGRKRKFSGK